MYHKVFSADLHFHDTNSDVQFDCYCAAAKAGILSIVITMQQYVVHDGMKGKNLGRFTRALRHIVKHHTRRRRDGIPGLPAEELELFAHTERFNHAVFLHTLGEAEESQGNYDEAVSAYEVIP